MMAVNIQGGFHRDVPLGLRQAAEGVDKPAADGWLPAAKGDAAASGLEIQVVDHHFIEQFCRCDGSREAVGTQALGIQAIPATQRAAVKGDQSGHPLPVNRQPMTGHPDNRHPIIMIINH